MLTPEGFEEERRRAKRAQADAAAHTLRELADAIDAGTVTVLSLGISPVGDQREATYRSQLGLYYSRQRAEEREEA